MREVCGSLRWLQEAVFVAAAVLKRTTPIQGSAAAVANATDPALLPRRPYQQVCSSPYRQRKRPNRAAGAAILVGPATAGAVVSQVLLPIGYSLQNKTEIAGCEGWLISGGFATAPGKETAVAAAAAVLGYSDLAPAYLASTLASAAPVAVADAAETTVAYDARVHRPVGAPLQTMRPAHSQSRLQYHHQQLPDSGPGAKPLPPPPPPALRASARVVAFAVAGAVSAGWPGQYHVHTNEYNVISNTKR